MDFFGIGFIIKLSVNLLAYSIIHSYPLDMNCDHLLRLEAESNQRGNLEGKPAD